LRKCSHENSTKTNTPFLYLLLTTSRAFAHPITNSLPHLIHFFAYNSLKKLFLVTPCKLRHVVGKGTSSSSNFSVRFLKLTQYDTCSDFCDLPGKCAAILLHNVLSETLAGRNVPPWHARFFHRTYSLDFLVGIFLSACLTFSDLAWRKWWYRGNNRLRGMSALCIRIAATGSTITGW
jgi:hypothetical protein